MSLPSTQIIEGSLAFMFPEGWESLKYDDSAFYRRHFQSFAGGSKGVDIVAFRNQELWLVEVKDYRIHPRDNPKELFHEVASKVRATLAGLVAARSPTGPSGDEQARRFADRALRSSRGVRVALHIEQPVSPSKLRPQAIDPKTARDLLRRALRPVDPHAEVGGTGFFNDRGRWSVR